MAMEGLWLVRSKVRLFKDGLARLRVDILNSLHIRDAELTRLRLRGMALLDYERMRRRLRSHERHGIRVLDADGNEIDFLRSDSFIFRGGRRRASPRPPESGGLMARRPRERLRRLSRDLSVTLPTVAAFVFVPFVGYSFLLLGMTFPRMLLSGQFHTREQRREFAAREYGERREHWAGLDDVFWACCMRNPPASVEGIGGDGVADPSTVGSPSGSGEGPGTFPTSLAFARMDPSAGPVFDRRSVRALRRLCEDDVGPALDDLHPPHLLSLALSNGMSSTTPLPSALVPAFLRTCVPEAYLRRRLSRLSEDLIADDSALLEEGCLEDGCRGMTDEEVLDACRLRGLPAGGGDAGRREALTDHLTMMEGVMAESSDVESGAGRLRPRGSLVRDPSLNLLVLHLQAIRFGAMKRWREVRGNG